MKKFFQIVLFYSVGLACVFALAWRVNSIDVNEEKLAENYNYKYACRN